MDYAGKQSTELAVGLYYLRQDACGLSAARLASLIDLARIEAERLCEAGPLNRTSPAGESVAREAELQAA